MGYIVQGNLSVDAELLAFVNDELLPAASLDPSTFWQGFDASVHKLAPRNAELLEARETLQAQIDTWLVENRAAGLDTDAYNAFLKEIGYLVPEGDDFVISTENVDDEIARIAACMMPYMEQMCWMRATGQKKPVAIIRCAARRLSPMPAHCLMNAPRWTMRPGIQ